MIQGGYPGGVTVVIGQGGGLFEGWVLVERIEILLALPDQIPSGGGGDSRQSAREGVDDADVGCAREVGLEACRGCRVLGVSGGVIAHECIGLEGPDASDMLLLDDERRSTRFARAASAVQVLPQCYSPAAGSAGVGCSMGGMLDYVTVTVTSCGRLSLLAQVLDNVHPLRAPLLLPSPLLLWQSILIFPLVPPGPLCTHTPSPRDNLLTVC